jgi:hypothetical protein
VYIENIQAKSLHQYDKKKYKEMILDVAQTVFGNFVFNMTYCMEISKRISKKEIVV